MSNYIEERPWGKFEILVDNEKVKVKFITVNCGQRLSLQYHAKRSEDWTVISGVGTFTLDDMTAEFEPGTKLHIPALGKHRIANHGKEPLVILEVQNGTYFGEDDIVRISDDYGR